MTEKSQDAAEGRDDEAPGVRNELSGTVYGPALQAGHIEHLHLHLGTAVLPTPRQLPPQPRQFVNRETEIRSIDQVVAHPVGAGAPPIVVLFGRHGVGKSATGAHWAHNNHERFGDGQLYVDFGALRQDGGVGVADVLGGLLRALGLSDDVIPKRLEERTALFRSRVAGRRMLLLLDDVEHAAQVRPLLPSTADCTVLVTSRSPLPELVSSDGATVVPLTPLDEESSTSLLEELIGAERVQREPDATATLATLCGGLPVALRICGARLSAEHAHKPVSWLTDQLADEEKRLSRMVVGEERSLQAVFDDAYHALSPEHASLYRRLGLHPGPSFTAAAAATAIETSVERAAELLGDLCRAHLIEDAGDRYRFHDLLRGHARGAAQQEESPAGEAATVRAFVAHYLAATQRMDRAIVPERLRLSADCPAAAPGEPAPASAAQALAWFEAERPNIVAAQRIAVEQHWDEPAWQFAEALWLGYQNHKHFEESREVYERGLTAAKRLGVAEIEARMRQQLSRALMDLDEHVLAGRELDEAMRLLERSEHRRLRASVVEFTGVLCLNLGEHAAAVDAFERARAVYEEEQNSRGVMLQEYLLGRALSAMGEHAAAVERFEQALALTDPEADGLSYGRTLLRLGAAQRALGDERAAMATLERSARTMREHDAPYFELRALERLAELHRAHDDRLGETGDLSRMLQLLVSLSSPRAHEVRARLQELLP